MKAKLLTLSAAVALTLGSVSASAVDFHGYMRAGLNYSSNGGDAYCIGTGNEVHLLGRLGDECDTYAELTLAQEVYNKGNNKFTVHTLVAYGTEEGNWDHQGNSWQGVGGNGPWGGQRLSLREAYSDYEMPSGVTLWAGKRYYQRKDVHIMDYYYLNNSGNGFGVENIALNGLGALSFALIKQQTAPNNVDLNSWKLDARWNGIPMWADASLDVAMIYGWQNLSKAEKDAGDHINNGFLAMIEWTQGNFFGGFNKLSFTYGLDGFQYVGKIHGGNHAGDNVQPYHNRGNGIRFLDWGVIEQPKWNLGYEIMFTHYSADRKNGNDNWGAGWIGSRGNDFNFILRPSYKWSDYTSTVLEFGYASLNNGVNHNWDDPNEANPIGRSFSRNILKNRVSGSKLTIAQQWSPATHFWARPSIRIFAEWMSGGMMDHHHTGFFKKNHQYVYGAQVEAWW